MFFSETKNGKTSLCHFSFSVKLGRKAAETDRDINQAFGIGTTTERTAQWWLKKFPVDDESLEDDERSGRPSDVDNDQLTALVEANTCTTARELASELDVTYTTIFYLRQGYLVSLYFTQLILFQPIKLKEPLIYV